VPTEPTASALAVGQRHAEQALPRDASRKHVPQRRPAGAAPWARTRIRGRAPAKEFITVQAQQSGKTCAAAYQHRSARAAQAASHRVTWRLLRATPRAALQLQLPFHGLKPSAPGPPVWQPTQRTLPQWRRSNPTATPTGRGAACFCGARSHQARPPGTRWRRRRRRRLLPVLPHRCACSQSLLRCARCRATLGPRCQ